MRTTLLAILLTLASALSGDPLAGLWKGKRYFGPEAHGTLLITRSGGSMTADFMGRVVAVRNDSGELVFDLPNALGTFRGKLESDGSILGHWIQSSDGAESDRRATTLVLKSDAPNRWRGVVTPWPNEFTYYLLITERPDGTLGALLRNVERDIGTQYGVNQLKRDGKALILMGTREVGRGTYDAESDTMTLALRGGSYDFARDNDESEFYPRGKNPAPYRYRAPPALADGWPTNTLDAANISRPAMERLVDMIDRMPMDSPDASQVHALLIARGGKLVLEEYFHGEHREKPHDLRSASKSVAAIIAGAAMHAGAPLRLSTPVYATMKMDAADDPRKKSMTLEHLLTMSGGFFCDDTNDAAPGNEETMNDQTAEPDYYKFTMRVPLATPPGENSVYCSAMPHLALGVIGAATGESPMYTFDRLVARPMQITHYAWLLDPAGHPYGGGSFRVLPRDFAKFGQLMLNHGMWNGRAILDRQFAAAAISPQYHLRNIAYGYYFWIEDLPYKNRVVRSISMRGAGGQYVTIVPELDLLVATNAGSYSSRPGQFAIGNFVPRFILPAVREAGDDPNAPVVEREFTSPYGPSKDGSRMKKN